MTTTTVRTTDLEAALSADDPSVRLRAALAVGTAARADLLDALVGRCAVEPDFFVRDMLTWALCRLPVDTTVPRVLTELDSPISQARSQALHTLSKIGDRRAWSAVVAHLHADVDEVARSAWRAAVALVPADGEAALAADLATELGRGDREMALSLSRALVGLGEAVVPVLDAAVAAPDPDVRAHAAATLRLRDDPDSGFTVSSDFATRVAITGAGG